MSIVVTEVMASGAGGGAQVHVQNLVSGLDPTLFDVEVISLSDGPAVRRMRAAGITVHVVDEADDDVAHGARRWTCFHAGRPRSIHNHMYRAEVLGTRAALILAEHGLRASVHREHGSFEPGT